MAKAPSAWTCATVGVHLVARDSLRSSPVVEELPCCVSVVEVGFHKQRLGRQGDGGVTGP